MNFGYCKLDITPSDPVYMAGYSRKEKSKGVLDPIQVNAFVIEENGVKALWCIVDSIIIENSVIIPAKKAISKELNLYEEQIVIGCIHTHSAPAYFKLFYEDTKVEKDLQERLIEQIVSCSIEANRTLQPAVCHIKKTAIDGLYGNRNEMNGYSNKNVYIFEFMNDNHLVGTILQMACHPTILDGSNMMLSADLLGWVRNTYENKSGAPAMIINGCTGDVSTRFYRKLKGVPELERITHEIFKQMDFIEDLPYKLGKLSFENVEVQYPFDARSDAWTSKEIERLGNILESSKDPMQAGMVKQIRKNLLIKCERSPMLLTLTSQIVLSGDVLFISLPGDITAELGRRLEAAFPDKLVIPVCYSGHYSNYFVCKEDYGKYFETYISRLAKGNADDFIERIIEKTKSLIERVENKAETYPDSAVSYNSSSVFSL